MAQRIITGEPFERRYGASSAVRIGDRLFVSGLKVELEDGRGQGLTSGAEEVLSRAEMLLSDLVRTRIFYLQPEDYASLGAAHGEAFRDLPAPPAMSLTQVHHLPNGVRATMEVEAIQSERAAKRAFAYDMPNAREWGYSGVVQVGDELWVAGVTALRPDGSIDAPGDLGAQSREASARVISMIESSGGRRTDIVATRHYTSVAYVGLNTVPDRLSLMHPHHPTSAGITVQGLGDPRMGELIEVEAVVGATEGRHNLNTGRPYEEDHHYCRSIRMGDVVYIFGTTSVQLEEQVGSPFDAYGQTLQTLEWIRWGIEGQGLSFGDLVRTRCYVVGEDNVEHVARALRETLGEIAPAATVVGVPALGRPSILVEIEATAVLGAAG